MPYCVKCGVELAASESVCPLCLTPVIIPDEKLPEGEKPYPSQLETVNARIDRRYGAKLAMLILFIPMLVVLICDLLISYRVTWSAYVFGAGGCVCCWVILPFYLGLSKPYMYLVIDFLSTAAYLALIAWQTNGYGWYTALALPLTLLTGLCCVACVYAARRKRQSVFTRISNMILSLAALLIGVEIVTDLYMQNGLRLQWSIYALAPLLALAGIFYIIARNARLKAVIQRRLFF